VIMARKGLLGRTRSPIVADPYFDDRAPVVLGEGAHEPPDRLRYGVLWERGATVRIAVRPGPPPHDDWPFRSDAASIQRRLQGHRPQVSAARQFPRPMQAGVRRSDVGATTDQNYAEVLGEDGGP